LTILGVIFLRNEIFCAKIVLAYLQKAWFGELIHIGTHIEGPGRKDPDDFKAKCVSIPQTRLSEDMLRLFLHKKSHFSGK
jgi:hypothetical protein